MEIVRVIRSAELPPRHGLFAWRCTVRGTTLEGRSRQPRRAIKRMGGLASTAQIGPAQIGLYREGRDKPDAICGLDWGAAHTVMETRATGPRFAKWRPPSDKLVASRGMAPPPVDGFLPHQNRVQSAAEPPEPIS
jgi:hypothetical protein